MMAMTADGVPLYFGHAGPTIEHANAIEYAAAVVEQRVLRRRTSTKCRSKQSRLAATALKDGEHRAAKIR